MRVTFLFNRKKRPLDRNGEAPIDIQISLNGKRLRRQLPISVKPKEWDKKKQRVKSRQDSLRLNLIITSFEKKATTFYFDQLAAGLTPSIDQIMDHIFGKATSGPVTFNEYAEKKLEQFASHLAPGSVRQHALAIKYLNRYNPYLAFSQITYKQMKAFEAWLLGQDLTRGAGRKVSVNYAASLISYLKTYINEALREELIIRDPFINFKVKTEDSSLVWLNSVEFARFEAVKPKYASQQGSKTRYVFSTMTGLRYSDSESLQVKHFEETKEGLRLTRKPDKTRKRPYIINLPLYSLFQGRPEKMARELIKGKDPEEYVFDSIHYMTYNRHVKELAKQAGIKKPITTHTARHSFAMILLNEYRMPLEVVQELMAHGNIATTQIYARLTTHSVDDIVKDRFS